MARPKGIELHLEGDRLVVVRLIERLQGGFTREVLISDAKDIRIKAKPERNNSGLLRVKVSSQRELNLILDGNQRLEVTGTAAGDTMILTAAPDGAPSLEIIS